MIDCDANEVRWRVVEPVVSSLVKPNELERVDVGFGPREPMRGWDTTSGTGGAELWALIRAKGQTWHSAIWSPTNSGHQTLGAVAEQLARRLEDWVCEKVAWGEQRIADYVIPPRKVD